MRARYLGNFYEFYSFRSSAQTIEKFEILRASRRKRIKFSTKKSSVLFFVRLPEMAFFGQTVTWKIFLQLFFVISTMTRPILKPQLLIHAKGSQWPHYVKNSWKSMQPFARKIELKLAKKDQISKNSVFFDFFEYYRKNGWSWGKIGYTIRKSIKFRTTGLVLVLLRFIYT